MKHVKITKFHKYGSAYLVYLGNGTTHNFKQTREAKRFLALTSKFLTKSLYELRFIFGQVNLIYIKNWAYFRHDKPSMSHRHVMDENFCKETLRFCEDNFDLIINRCQYPNGNYFAFQKQSLITANLKNIILRLDKLHKIKSNAVERFEFDALFDRLKMIDQALQEYGLHKAYTSFVLPIHIGDDQGEFIPDLKFTA